MVMSNGVFFIQIVDAEVLSDIGELISIASLIDVLIFRVRLLNPRRSPWGRVRQSRVGAGVSLRRYGCWAGVLSCLLYTSDAADE